MHTMRRMLLATLLAALAWHAAAQPARPPIGTATMRADGTIVLDLRAEGPGGAVGQGRLTYPPDHPQYAAVLRHLGGLRPGETKPVPPWD
jgi:hypothetical protein